MDADHNDKIHSALQVADKFTLIGGFLLRLTKENETLNELLGGLINSLGAVATLAAEVRRYQHEQLKGEMRAVGLGRG